MKNAWPVEAQALGGRHYRLAANGNPCIDQNFDVYAVEYTFDDGAKLFVDGRCLAGADQIYSSYVHGTKGFAVASKSGDCGGPSSIHKGQSARSETLWQSKVAPEEGNPYQNEWNDLIDAIRNDKPYNEVEHGVKASLTGSLGRKAAHTGVKITFDDMLNSPEEYAPGVDKLTMDSPSPLPADAEGKYPIPQPGLVTNREY
jgi:predicted dehydrogenase